MKEELTIERRLCNVLFFSGLILLVFSIVMLFYTSIDVAQINWEEFDPEIRNELITYCVITFSTIAFKIVLSIYALNAKNHFDDIINPLFTFTVLFTLFVIMKSVLFFHSGGFGSASTINSASTMIDIIIAAFLLVITLIFKIDDWRPYKKGESK